MSKKDRVQKNQQPINVAGNNDQQAPVVETPVVDTPVADEPAVETPEVTKPALPEGVDYSEAKIAELFPADGRGKDVAIRLSIYLRGIQQDTNYEDLHYKAHYMAEVLSLFNAMKPAEFAKNLTAFVDFIADDLTKFGKESLFHGFAYHKPFFGTRPHAAIFLEMCVQAAPKASRAQVAGLIERSPQLKTIMPAKHALFVQVLRG